jgi:hypothetical protein
VPDNCRRVKAVTRRFGWRRVPMSTLAKCDFRAGVLSDKRITDRNSLWRFYYAGWYVTGRTQAQQPVLALTPAADLRGQRLALEIRMDRSVPLRATVAGQPVDPVADASTALVPLPSDATAAATESHPLLVQLMSADGSNLDFTMKSLRLVKESRT